MSRKSGLALGLSDFGFRSNSSRFNNISEYNIQTNYRIKSKVTSNIQIGSLRNALDAAFLEALTQISDQLNQKLRDAILSNKWVTNNGLGDIYSSGELLNSQHVSPRDSGIMINYDVPYANLIHYGGYIVPYGSQYNAKVYIPPRPWITAVVNGEYGIVQIDYQQIIYTALRKVTK